MAFFNGINDLRMILDTETDADSELDEELLSQIRENIEVLLQLVFGRVASGTLTSDPPNDTTGYVIDTAAGFADDEHNGRTLLFTSGNAKGDIYTIDDTVAASNRCECTGDNLYSAGARSGDSYLILYDLKVNTDGHDHDGVNSKTLGDFTMSAGNVRVHNSGTQNDTFTTSYVKVWEVNIGLMQGTLRTKLTLESNDNTTTVYGRIYRNGVLVGTERSMNSSTPQSWTEDIAGWSKGDLLQLYVQRSIGSVAEDWVLQIGVDTPITPTEEVIS